MFGLNNSSQHIPSTSRPRVRAPYGHWAVSLGLALTVSLLGGCSNQKNQSEDIVRAALQQQQQGRYEDAVQSLTRSIALNPDFAEAYYLRGTSYAVLEDLDSAIADLQLATRKKPDWDRAWWALGTMYRTADRHDDALDALSRAIRLNPQAADAHFDRACVREHLGRHAEALADFATTARLDANHVQAHLHCGILQTQDSPALAVETLSAALCLDRRNGQIWLHRGLAHEANGAPERSLADLTVACRLLQKDGLSWYHRGRILNSLGHQDEAVHDLSKAAELDPDNLKIRDAPRLIATIPAKVNVLAKTDAATKASNVSVPEIGEEPQLASSQGFRLFPIGESKVDLDPEPESGDTQTSPLPRQFKLSPTEDLALTASTSEAASLIPEADRTDVGETKSFALFPMEADGEQQASDQHVALLQDSQQPVQTPANGQQLSAADLAVPMLLPTTELLLSTADDADNPFAVVANEAESGNTAHDVRDSREAAEPDPFAHRHIEAETTTPRKGLVVGSILPPVSEPPTDSGTATFSIPDPVLDCDLLYQRALEAHRNNDRPACLAALELFLTEKPEHTDARLRYAIVLAEHNRPQAALAAAEALLRDSPDNVQVLRFTADLLRDINQVEAAVTAYTRLLSSGTSKAAADGASMV